MPLKPCVLTLARLLATTFNFSSSARIPEAAAYNAVIAIVSHTPAAGRPGHPIHSSKAYLSKPLSSASQRSGKEDLCPTGKNS